MDSCEKCYKFYNSVECSAFKPNLSVIGEAKTKHKIAENDNHEIKVTDNHKWVKAWAVQQWKYEDSQLFYDLNYHLCLLSKNRNTIGNKLKNLKKKRIKCLIHLN